MEFTKSYDRMRSFMDVSERAVLIIAKNPDLTKSLGITPSTFLTLPQWCETNFMSLAYRNSVAYPDPGPFLILFQVPYLRWLRHFATMCREVRLVAEGPDSRSPNRLFSSRLHKEELTPSPSSSGASKASLFGSLSPWRRQSSTKRVEVD